jgi:hypothetical protein
MFYVLAGNWRILGDLPGAISYKAVWGSLSGVSIAGASLLGDKMW